MKTETDAYGHSFQVREVGDVCACDSCNWSPTCPSAGAGKCENFEKRGQHVVATWTAPSNIAAGQVARMENPPGFAVVEGRAVCNIYTGDRVAFEVQENGEILAVPDQWAKTRQEIAKLETNEDEDQWKKVNFGAVPKFTRAVLLKTELRESVRMGDVLRYKMNLTTTVEARAWCDIRSGVRVIFEQQSDGKMYAVPESRLDEMHAGLALAEAVSNAAPQSTSRQCVTCARLPTCSREAERPDGCCSAWQGPIRAGDMLTARDGSMVKALPSPTVEGPSLMRSAYRAWVKAGKPKATRWDLVEQAERDKHPLKEFTVEEWRDWEKAGKPMPILPGDVLLNPTETYKTEKKTVHVDFVPPSPESIQASAVELKKHMERMLAKYATPMMGTIVALPDGRMKWEPAGPSALMPPTMVSVIRGGRTKEDYSAEKVAVHKDLTVHTPGARCTVPAPLRVSVKPSSMPRESSFVRDRDREHRNIDVGLVYRTMAAVEARLEVVNSLLDGLERRARSLWIRTHPSWPLCRLGGTINLQWQRETTTGSSIGRFICSHCEMP